MLKNLLAGAPAALFEPAVPPSGPPPEHASARVNSNAKSVETPCRKLMDLVDIGAA